MSLNRWCMSQANEHHPPCRQANGAAAAVQLHGAAPQKKQFCHALGRVWWVAASSSALKFLWAVHAGPARLTGACRTAQPHAHLTVLAPQCGNTSTAYNRHLAAHALHWHDCNAGSHVAWAHPGPSRPPAAPALQARDCNVAARAPGDALTERGSSAGRFATCA